MGQIASTMVSVCVIENTSPETVSDNIIIINCAIWHMGQLRYISLSKACIYVYSYN